MFVVEPGSGRNKGYASAEELGAAIRRGELGPGARIYHRATDRWLPISAHPEYRKVAAERELSSALAMKARRWTFLPHAPPQEAAQGRPPESRVPSASEAQLILGEPDRSWFGSTLRRLRNIAHR